MAAEEMNVNKDEVKPYSIVVKISSDYLSATLTLIKIDDSVEVTVQNLLDALKKKNVTFGIDLVKIKAIAAAQQAEDEVVAKGKPFFHGIDSEIEYKVDLAESSKPTINEDGTVDFKNINFLVSVKKGQVLAVKTRATKGITGTLVTGKIMKGRDGRIVNFKFGENVLLSEDGHSLISAEDGCVEVVHEKIIVKKAINIQGDVGPKTGNINFDGSVYVSGNVLTGYEVKATSDITIHGIVESSLIKSDKDVIIAGGVQGNDDADIIAAGNVISKFLNNVNVEAGGFVECDSILHSKVKADGYVKVNGKKGLIVGGRVVAKEYVVAKQIGTNMGTKTSVEVGMTREFIDELKDKNEELKVEIYAKNKLDTVIDLLERQYNVSKDSVVLESIDKSKESRLEYEKNIEQIKARIAKMEELTEIMKDSYVKVNHLFQGVRIKIGSAFHIVEQEILDVKLRKKKSVVEIESF